MLSLKIGDTVMYTKHVCSVDHKHFKINKLYEIIGVEDEDFYFKGVNCNVYEEQISLGVKDTKIARKVYKNRIVAEKNGYLFLQNEEK